MSPKIGWYSPGEWLPSLGSRFLKPAVQDPGELPFSLRIVSLWFPTMQDSLTERASLAWTIWPNLPSALTIRQIGNGMEGHVIGRFSAATDTSPKPGEFFALGTHILLMFWNNSTFVF